MIRVLCELTIQNFALIAELRVAFGPGFTVLTGETGAGKSIIIDALNAVLGERVGPEAIRSDAGKAVVEAVFEAIDAPRALAALERSGLRDGEEDTIILSRQIGSERSSYYVNRRPSTRTALREIGQHLADIHGQHEHQTLIHERNHLSFLDVFGGAQHLEHCADYAQSYAAFGRARQTLENMRLSERERAQRVDMLRFQVEEIKQANLQPGEEEDLRAERNRLSHAERLQQAVATALELTEGELSGGGASDAVGTASQELEQACKYDEQLRPLAKELDAAAITLQEAVRSLHDYEERLEFDPERLEQTGARVKLIADLKRKYGDTVEEILDYYERISAELKDLENADSRAEQLVAEVAELRKQAGKRATELSAQRRKLAIKLEKTVVEELRHLEMEQTSFRVEFDRQPNREGLWAEDGNCYQADEWGLDRVRFLLSANAGEPLKPLSKVASGGELSRLMLAFKSICSRGAETATIVFDEIDVGIGGMTADAIGQKLASIGQTAQVLCVTHLPQIARMADAHLAVTKQTEGKRTVIKAQMLTEQERIQELARMFGAAEDEKAAYQHARQMLAEAKDEKQTLRAASATGVGATNPRPQQAGERPDTD